MLDAINANWKTTGCVWRADVSSPTLDERADLSWWWFFFRARLKTEKSFSCLAARRFWMDRIRKVGQTFPLFMSFNSDVLAAVEVLAACSRLCPVLKLQQQLRVSRHLLMSTTSARQHGSRCLEALWSAGAPTLLTDWFFLVLTVWTGALRRAVVRLWTSGKSRAERCRQVMLNVLRPRAAVLLLKGALRQFWPLLTFGAALWWHH